MGSAATQVYHEQGVTFFLSLWGPAEEFQNVRRSFPGTLLQEATQLATTEHLSQCKVMTLKKYVASYLDSSKFFISPSMLAFFGCTFPFNLQL